MWILLGNFGTKLAYFFLQHLVTLRGETQMLSIKTSSSFKLLFYANLFPFDRARATFKSRYRSHRRCRRQCDQMLKLKVAQFSIKVTLNLSTVGSLTYNVTFLKIAQKAAKYLGYFCKKNCH